MHLPPEVWGPIFWATMHIISLGYPDEPSYAEKRAAKEFYMGMQHLLPCPTCREHFKGVLQGLPIESWLDNRTSLTEWVWMAHNEVNRRLERPTYTKDEFFAAYGAMADRGAPIPPSAPIAERDSAAVQHAYVRGATHAGAAILAVSVVGALLWFSYKQKK